MRRRTLPITRKVKLIQRAARCSDRLHRKNYAWDNAHDGFMEGYRAAMSDLRKLIRTESREVHKAIPLRATTFEGAVDDVRRRRAVIMVAVEQFIKPIR